MENSISSCVVIVEGEEIDARCEDETLILSIQTTEIMRSLFSKDEDGNYCFAKSITIDGSPISGLLDQEKKAILFFPNFARRLDYCFPTLTVKIPLLGYCVLPKDEDTIHEPTVFIESAQMHLFLGLERRFRTTTRNGKKEYHFSQDLGPTGVCTTIRVEEREMVISPGYFDYPNTAPALKVQAKGEWLPSDLFYLVNRFVFLLRFLFFRRDFHPDVIRVTDKERHGEGGIVLLPSERAAPSDDFECGCSDSIPWSIAAPHFQKLFEAVSSLEILLDYIPGDKNGRLSSSLVGIQADSACFESAFNASGIQAPESIERRNAKKEVKDLLDREFDRYKSINPHVAEVLRELKGNFLPIPLRKKMVLAFQFYEKSLSWLKEKVAPDYTYEDISATCSQLRNKVDHGNSKRYLDQKVARCFVMLRAVTLCIQLGIIGMKEDEITDSLGMVFGIKELGGNERQSEIVYLH